MLASFLPRFMALVDGLMSHPRVRVTHLWVGPPATDAALQLLPQIEAFLRQERSDRSDFAVTRRRLLGLFAGSADPG